MSIYNDSNYYVYLYLRPDYTPYYVGKGKDNRAYRKHKGISVPKDKSRIILIQDNLTELQSLILERYYIRWFGRKDNNTGILRNLTDGGEGSSGRVNSQDTCNKISIGVKQSIIYKTCPHCDKTIDKSNYNKYHGDKCSVYTGIKRPSPKWEPHSISKVTKSKCKYTYTVYPPNGEPFIIDNVMKFSKDNGFSHGDIYGVINGRLKHSKGYRFIRN